MLTVDFKRSTYDHQHNFRRLDSNRQNGTIMEHPPYDGVTVKPSDLGLTVSSVTIKDEKKNERNRKVWRPYFFLYYHRKRTSSPAHSCIDLLVQLMNIL